METFMTGIYNWVTEWKDFIYMLCAVSLVIVGVMFIIPSEKSKEFAKSQLPLIVVGAGIVFCAITFAKEISEAWVL